MLLCFVSENNDDSKVPKKTVTFENTQYEVTTSSSLNKNRTTENKLKLVSHKIMSSPKNKVESKAKPTLTPYHLKPKECEHAASGNRNISYNNSLKNPIQGRKLINCTKTLNPRQRQTVKRSEGTKTVVEQVVKNVSSNKPILIKHLSNVNHTSKEASSNVNVLYEVINKKGTSKQVDQWIEERSLKIKKIHDELNNIVSRSAENYLKTQPADKIKGKTDSNKGESKDEIDTTHNNEEELR